MNIKSLTVAVSALVLSTSVNAVVLNTLNGVDYQWLELTETAGLSRDTVELRLADVNDELYGYEYASRQLVEDLLLSYTSFPGANGWYGAAGLVAGVDSLLDDFGATYSYLGKGRDTQWTTLDGYEVTFDGYRRNYGLYGTSGECGILYSCYTADFAYKYTNGDTSMVSLYAERGYSSSAPTSQTYLTARAHDYFGSYLVQTVVPVPAAVWLFGSGLIGLIGVAKRKVRV